jgi:hypothetical protein
MIVVIVNHETDKNGIPRLIASHGIDFDTLQTVILPAEHPQNLGAVFNPIIGEFVINE